MAKLPRRLVDQAFDDERRLRPPGSAIGRDGHGVGQIALHRPGNHRRLVNPGDAPEIHHRRQGPGRGIGAHVQFQHYGQRGETPFRVQPQFRGEFHRPPALVRQQRLAPVGAPAHGAVQFAAGPEAQHLLADRAGLHPEGPAHIGPDHADRRGLHPEGRRQRTAHRRRVLVAGVEPEAPARLRTRKGRPRLHRHRRHARDRGRQRHPVRRRRQRLFRSIPVAPRPVRRKIAGPVRMHQPRATGLRVGNGHHRLVFRQIRRDKLCRVQRRLAGLCHHHGQRFADEPRLVPRQQITVRLNPLVPVRPFQRHRRRHRPDSVRRQIRFGKDGHDARHSDRVRHVDPRYGRRAVGRAHEHRPERALGMEVVGIPALPGRQAMILDPAGPGCLGRAHGNLLASRQYRRSGAPVGPAMLCDNVRAVKPMPQERCTVSHRPDAVLPVSRTGQAKRARRSPAAASSSATSCATISPALCPAPAWAIAAEQDISPTSMSPVV